MARSLGDRCGRPEAAAWIRAVDLVHRSDVLAFAADSPSILPSNIGDDDRGGLGQRGTHRRRRHDQRPAHPWYGGWRLVGHRGARDVEHPGLWGAVGPHRWGGCRARDWTTDR